MSPKTPSPMIAILLVLGGGVFGVLGGLHAIYTLLDLRNPRRLVPVDPSVAHAMANSAVRLSGGARILAKADRWLLKGLNEGSCKIDLQLPSGIYLPSGL